ncbi:bifunctional hydroxymethylpyrimidine kinase/phosphomethylpyrimidine kinase [Gemmobacter sp. LW-1]|uniref:bifunctional hydroxymethylpyrimidine kinase/phosphomethylpyrimidine kinase n=1 Tax=Gemmobacter sp. LW-1 TaxID=1529005 RepID=UPI0006C756E1|nr:bifunctional hydroxymethylpyrimidine kinase/phosphomethylpyrimidine kinase [Gemmobacter sp. LW-1]
MTPRVLCIGGSDSGGGAGLARDIATATGMGAHACIAVTAVTAQTDAGVLASHPVSPETVAAQIRAAGRVDAVKIGMLASAAIVEAVAAALPQAPVVLDPVLASSSGHPLLDPQGVAALLRLLLPRVTLLTPNLPELQALTTPGLEAAQVQTLRDRGCAAVLVKGGHAETADCEDRLYAARRGPHCYSGPRYPASLRGTGCTLASAIAVALARGEPLPRAIGTARDVLRARFTEAASVDKPPPNPDP